MNNSWEVCLNDIHDLSDDSPSHKRCTLTFHISRKQLLKHVPIMYSVHGVIALMSLGTVHDYLLTHGDVCV